MLSRYRKFNKFKNIDLKKFEKNYFTSMNAMKNDTIDNLLSSSTDVNSSSSITSKNACAMEESPYYIHKVKKF